MIKTITFNCELLSPLFCFGADQKTPEIRTASIKGAMRFWWRALKAQSGEDFKKLQKDEAEIFGSAGAGTKSRKSAFTLRVENETNNFNKIEIPEKEDETIKCKYYGKESGDFYRGIKYLYYSMLMKGGKCGILPGSKFNVSLIFRSNYEEEAVMAFLALSLFGGIGSRSRRGAGNFWIKKIICKNIKNEEEQKKLTDLYNSFPNIKDSKITENLLSKAFKGIKTFKNNEEFKSENMFQSDCKYSVLRNAAIIYFDSVAEEWIEALNSIGKPFRDFRCKNKGRVDETVFFGLPITHGKNPNNKINVKPKDSGRRASPLIFHLHKNHDGKLHPFLLLLNGEFLPNNAIKIGNEYKRVGNKEIIIDCIKKIQKPVGSTQEKSQGGGE